MTYYTDEVLKLIQMNPGLRSTQISDRLDIDLEIVENVIAKAMRDNQVEVQEVVGPNNRLTNTYHWIGVAPLGWIAPQVAAAGAADSVEETPSAETSPVEAATTPRRSKAAIAIEYLIAKGPATRKALAKLMGLANASQVSQYLRPHLQSGKVACIDGIYCVPDSPAVASSGASPAGTAAVHGATVVESDAVKSPAHYTSGGIELVDILRAKLTPEELRGFFKGNVIKYLLRAEHKGGAQDYQKGCVYANWLAQATTAHAA